VATLQDIAIKVEYGHCYWLLHSSGYVARCGLSCSIAFCNPRTHSLLFLYVEVRQVQSVLIDNHDHPTTLQHFRNQYSSVSVVIRLCLVFPRNRDAISTLSRPVRSLPRLLFTGYQRHILVAKRPVHEGNLRRSLKMSGVVAVLLQMLS